MNATVTAIPGVRVGHHTLPEARTGVTVIDFPEPNVAAVEIRGAAPGSRETALLAPGMRVETIQSLVFAGGSAFGLAAADGVVDELAKAGRGHPTPAGPVPIVPSAIIFDLMNGDGAVRPGPADGAAAFLAASSDPAPTGQVGAGTGATVANWRGPDASRPGGIGSAALRLGDAIVGVLVVLNAVGDVFTLEGEPLTGGPPIPSDDPGPSQARPMQNTTLVAVVTDARASRTDLLRLAVRAHDALGVTLRPAHTRYDGDAVFAISCGT
ncbi:MAG: P1 family peptidase, partial [Acidimicrobiia bacterium]|nr:P1 family peptidase [Acidimicrobiia bacterium]